MGVTGVPLWELFFLDLGIRVSALSARPQDRHWIGLVRPSFPLPPSLLSLFIS